MRFFIELLDLDRTINYIYVGALFCNHQYLKKIMNSLSVLCLCVILLSSITLIMRDRDEKVLAIDDLFYNMLSA